ncbi:GAF domain-containing SpoIIE family protein phosphatase [Acidobacteriota bacterium]
MSKAASECKNIKILCREYDVPSHLSPLKGISKSHAFIPLEENPELDALLNIEVSFPNGNIYTLPSRVEKKKNLSPSKLVECRFLFEDESISCQFRKDVESFNRDEEMLTQNKLYALMEISRTLETKIHFEDLLKGIIAKTTEIMNADRSTLFLYDEKRKELWGKVTEGLKKKTIRFPVSLGIAGHVAKTRQSLIIPDAYKDQRFNPDFDIRNNYTTQSILCVPLINNVGKLIGVIEVLNKRDGNAFDENDESLLSCLARFVVTALEKAQRIREYVKMQRIERELMFVRALQMSLLPKRLCPLSKHLDVHVNIIPAGSVGGDFYDFFFLDSSRLFFVIGDVSGKGMPAALFMAMTKTLIKAMAHEGFPPDVIAYKVNNELCRDNDSCMFVTIFLGILNIDSGEILYSNAGHSIPYLISKDGAVQELNIDEGVALGIIMDYRFKVQLAIMSKDSSLFLYTDGLSEAMDKSGNEFTCERIKQCLKVIQVHSAQNIINESMEAVMHFTRNTPQSDDIAIMTIQYLG